MSSLEVDMSYNQDGMESVMGSYQLIIEVLGSTDHDIDI
jgi:hypothetical protein